MESIKYLYSWYGLGVFKLCVASICQKSCDTEEEKNNDGDD